jgi:uncharacterized protein YdaL
MASAGTASRNAATSERYTLPRAPIPADATYASPGKASATALGKSMAAPAPPSTRTLILYDTTNNWGFLGELYATMTANLVSHFGTYKAEAVTAYTAGQENDYSAVIYIGSTWDEPIPTSFLDDVLSGSRRVMWIDRNIWELSGRAPDFESVYGWKWSGYDPATVSQVDYKGTALTRDGARAGGVMNYSYMDPQHVTALATAVRADGTSFPWALRSANLTYIGDNPFSNISETDRYLAFSDMLFDLLAPNTPARHRAMVRFEDITAESDPKTLKAAADYLHGQGIPFSFGVVPLYKDPLGADNGGVPTTIHLKDAKAIVNSINYMIRQGGTVVMHGYTHQYGTIPNPYSGVTPDDFEFYRAHIDAGNNVVLDGPVSEDSSQWALGRLNSGIDEFKAARLAVPTIFEFPHYAASAADYRAAASLFPIRYERSLYFGGVLSGGPIDPSHMAGQFFPYAVRDVYGVRVLPEDLGNYEPEPYNNHPARLPEQIIDSARRQLVIRDGVASFFYHPYYGLDALKQIVTGLRGAGYVFVGPQDVLNN